MRAADELIDVAIVGGGIGGVASLCYAKRAGLTARLFEKQDGVGGLWRQLPGWQDIQISPHDWALAGLPLASPYAADITANIGAWVEKFDLAGDISLSTPVLEATESPEGWLLATPAGRVRARHLIAATGAHNEPVIPAVRRAGSTVAELHSSALRDPALVRDRAVLVVGGGASALDLLDLCFEHGARRVAWVHRGLKWFMPTRKPKHIAGSVREFARIQMGSLAPQQQSAAIDSDMRSRYEKFGLKDIVPSRTFDVLQDQLMPGRHRMIANFAAIERHRGTIEAIEGCNVTLDSGAQLQCDLLLWGTGYAVDLSYFASPGLGSIRTLTQLRARCGGLVRSLDAPNLYFPGVCLDGIGTATWAYALMARSIASHIKGQARLDLVPVPHHVNHFELVRYLAERDPASYPPGWREHYRALALETPDSEPYPAP